MANGQRNWTVKRILIVAITLLALIVIAQNTSVVTFRFLFWQVGVSQILLLPLVLAAGFVIGLLAAWLMPKKRRRASDI